LQIPPSTRAQQKSRDGWKHNGGKGSSQDFRELGISDGVWGTQFTGPEFPVIQQE